MTLTLRGLIPLGAMREDLICPITAHVVLVRQA